VDIGRRTRALSYGRLTKETKSPSGLRGTGMTTSYFGPAGRVNFRVRLSPGESLDGGHRYLPYFKTKVPPPSITSFPLLPSPNSPWSRNASRRPSVCCQRATNEQMHADPGRRRERRQPRKAPIHISARTNRSSSPFLLPGAVSENQQANVSLFFSWKMSASLLAKKVSFLSPELAHSCDINPV